MDLVFKLERLQARGNIKVLENAGEQKISAYVSEVDAPYPWMKVRELLAFTRIREAREKSCLNLHLRELNSCLHYLLCAYESEWHGLKGSLMAKIITNLGMSVR